MATMQISRQVAGIVDMREIYPEIALRREIQHIEVEGEGEEEVEVDEVVEEETVADRQVIGSQSQQFQRASCPFR